MDEIDLPELDTYSYEPLREQVYEVLKNAILDGSLSPHQNIKETTVANKLNVSRTPVREALLMLELEGLLKISPQEGFIVQGITSKKQIRDLFQVRGQLEGLAARLAAENISPENLQQLNSTLNLMESKMEEDNAEDFLNFEFFFHRLIYKSSGNQYLNETLNRMFEQINRFRSKSFARQRRMQEVLEELNSLYEAMSGGDTVRAKTEAMKHLENAERAIIEAFDL